MTPIAPDPLRTRLGLLLEGDERPRQEVDRLVDLMVLLGTRSAPPDPEGMFPEYEPLQERFVEASHGGDPEALEERFNELYCHLHGFEAPYTAAERTRVDETGGYWCHAGGLSPLLKAERWIDETTVSADFGAGNGLQGLLLQKLYPHARVVQIEISSRMVAAGQRLQRWLDVPEQRVDWRVADVCEISPRGLDFIYLYRPLRPVGVGVDFYRRFAAALATESHAVTIFSVADCLKEHLPAAFDVIYDDGHLRCFRRGAR